jgi:hypothetical protein
MPNLTVTHEAPLELIKQHPALAVDLLREVTGIPLPEGLDVRLGPTSLNRVSPAKYDADSVVVLSDPATLKPLAVIVIEPQGRDEKTKSFPGRSMSPMSARRLDARVPSSSWYARTQAKRRSAGR